MVSLNREPGAPRVECARACWRCPDHAAWSGHARTVIGRRPGGRGAEVMCTVRSGWMRRPNSVAIGSSPFVSPIPYAVRLHSISRP